MLEVFIIFLSFSNPLTGLVLEILTTVQVMADWVVFNIAGVVVKVAEFPKLALMHGILLSLLI